MESTTPPIIKKRRWWLAAILSLLAPGLGHLYNAESTRAAIFIVLVFGSSALWWLFLLIVPPVSLTILLFALFFTLTMLLAYFYTAVDAALRARRIGVMGLTKWNRWYVYAAFAAVVCAFNLTADELLKPHRKWEPYHMAANSMAPNLPHGEHVMAWKGYYQDRDPERGNIAIFKFPPDNRTDYIKRVVGLPGDQVQMRDGVLRINGVAAKLQGIEAGSDYIETLPNGVRYRITDERQGSPFDNTPVHTLPPAHYFVLGDNRDNSLDSRAPAASNGVGFVPRENFRDRPMIIYWSTDLGRIGMSVQPGTAPNRD